MDSASLASHLVKLYACLICLLPEVDASRSCKRPSTLNAAMLMNDTGLLSVADRSSKNLCCCKPTGWIGGLFGRVDLSTCQLYEVPASSPTCPSGRQLNEGECGDWKGKFNPTNSTNLFNEVREELVNMGFSLNGLDVELSLNNVCYPGIYALATSSGRKEWSDALANFIPSATNVQGQGKKCLVRMSAFVDVAVINGKTCSWRETMDVNLKLLLGAAMGIPGAGVSAGISGWTGWIGRWILRRQAQISKSDEQRVKARINEVQKLFGSVSQMRRGYRAYLTMAVAHELIHCADFKDKQQSGWSMERRAMLMEQAFILEMEAGREVPEDWSELYEQVNTATWYSISEDIRKKIDHVWGKDSVVWNGDISTAASQLFNQHYGKEEELPLWLGIYTRFRRENFKAKPQKLKKGQAMEAVKGVLRNENVGWAFYRL